MSHRNLLFRIKTDPTHQRGAYPDLLSAGVRILSIVQGFIHSKQILVDKDFTAVGTINLDYRSLLHHYENAASI